MAILGSNLIVYRDGVAIAGTRSDEAENVADMIETASPDSGTAKTYRPGRTDWTINVSWLVLAEEGLQELLNAGKLYTLEFKGSNGTGVTGDAFLRTCSFRAPKGALVEGVFAFQGTGPLTPIEVNP